MNYQSYIKFTQSEVKKKHSVQTYTTCIWFFFKNLFNLVFIFPTPHNWYRMQIMKTLTHVRLRHVFFFFFFFFCKMIGSGTIYLATYVLRSINRGWNDRLHLKHFIMFLATRLPSCSFLKHNFNGMHYHFKIA